MTQKLTQAQRILRAFKENNNVLNLPQILMMRPIISQYTSRIKDLREEGYVIKNKTWHVDGVKHSKYTLISEPKKYESSPSEKPENFPSMAHKIAHENRLRESQKTDQLTLI